MLGTGPLSFSALSGASGGGVGRCCASQVLGKDDCMKRLFLPGNHIGMVLACGKRRNSMISSLDSFT